MLGINLKLRRLTVPILTCFLLLAALVLSAEHTQAETEEKEPATIENESYPSTSNGGYARDLAGEMLGKYPSLNANPYAVLVNFADDASQFEIEILLDTIGADIVEYYPTSKWYLVETVRGATNAERELGQSHLVDAVTLDHTIRANTVNTNDPLIGSVWGLDSNHGVDAEVAWAVSSDADEIVVAVIDSGVDIGHADLASVIWSNDDEIADNGIDDDGNGYIDDTYGWDFTGEYDNTPQDEHGHGTHVAGTIAAVRDNNEGIAGVADNVKIMALRFLDKNGSGVTSWAISALEYAVANGAQISNNSWGGGGYESALYNAIASAGNSGHLFVAAAGNSGLNADTNPMYPAAYDLPNILSIAAINSSGSLAGFSNYGSNRVDIAAPGVDILSTMSADSSACSSTPPCYTSWNGTSMAAPHAAGVAALMLGVNSTLTPEEMIQTMIDTVRPTAALNGKVLSNGELDGGAAVSAAASSGGIEFVSYSPGETILEGSTVALTAIATASDDTDLSTQIVWKDSGDNTIGNGSTVSFAATTIGVLSIKAEVQDISGVTLQKTAWFNVIEPTLNFLTPNGFIKGLAGETVNATWSWTGDSNEVADLEVMDTSRFFIEATTPDEYPLLDQSTNDFIISSTATGSLVDVIVGFRANHTWPGDLEVSLIHPDGTTVLLAQNEGWGSHRDGSEVWGTGSRSCSGEIAYFSDNAEEAINERQKPYSGFSIPRESLSSFDGKDADGDWILKLHDTAGQDEGEFFCGELILTTDTPTDQFTVSADVNLQTGLGSWILPDPIVNSGLYRYVIENTSLGTFTGDCCILVGLPELPSSAAAIRQGNSVSVSWTPSETDNSMGVSTYIVDIYEDPTSGINRGTCNTDANNCVIENLSGSLDYQVEIRSRNNVGSSDPFIITVEEFQNVIHQNTDGVTDEVEGGDRFGASSAYGDFDGDSNFDLVVSAPNEGGNGKSDSGLIHIFDGSLNWGNEESYDQGNIGTSTTPEDGDQFGVSLVTGDFNGDGFDDLTISVHLEDLGDQNQLVDAGMVILATGSSEGITTPATYTQDTNGIRGKSETGDRFGESIASGDINGDGYDDLVIGVPGEGIGRRDNAGAVNVLYGTRDGLSVADDQILHQNSSGVKGKAETGDAFGSALAVGDINGDGYDDLVIGVPGEGIGRNTAGAGGVNILYGSTNGLSGQGDKFFSQNTRGVKGKSEQGDNFGSFVALIDIDNDSMLDLVVGVPNEAIGSISKAGMVNALPNDGNGGFSTGDDVSFTANQNQFTGSAQANAQFGSWVLVRGMDLLIGSPGRIVEDYAAAGAFYHLRIDNP